jgi:hypothetical protein
MAKPAHVYRLDSYGLTLAALTRLGVREVRATVQLSGKSARQLWSMRPADRERVLRETLVRQFARLQRGFPDGRLVPRDRSKPRTIDATLPARVVGALAAAPSVSYVFIDAIAPPYAAGEADLALVLRVRCCRDPTLSTEVGREDRAIPVPARRRVLASATAYRQDYNGVLWGTRESPLTLARWAAFRACAVSGFR